MVGGGRSVEPLDQSTVQPRIDLGVVVAPGLARDVTAGIAENLLEDLRAHYDDVDWRTELSVDRLVVPPVPTTELLSAARRKLLTTDWDLAVVVTDLPLRVAGRTVPRHSNPTHGIAVVSLPALGPLHLRQRLRRAVLELVGELVGHGAEGRNLLRELGTEVANRPGFGFVPAVLLSHVRLLLGMVRANRPWRFAARLYGALVAALAVSVYGVVTSDIWRLSSALSWWRLTVTSLAALAVTVVGIIAVHGLWERAPDSRVRDQVVLFNFATTASVAIGIVSLYVALFALILGGAELVVTPHVFAGAIGHDAGLADYATLAWFVASLATIGGALGAGLESNEAIREAAYSSISEKELPSPQTKPLNSQDPPSPE
ncbi:MAG: hypothetical protein ACXVRU_07470 [Gaiellaceae bacterium]